MSATATAYANMASVSPARNSNTVDFRSDTVTRPSAEMRAAMVNAELGDDVFGEDPTVCLLEETTAELLGKEAGLFVPTGTQSNLCALLAHCGRGDEFLVGSGYHTHGAEAGGAAALGGIVPCPLPVSDTGALSAADIAAAIKPDNIHYPITRLLALENTVAGNVQSIGNIREWSRIAKQADLSVHLDGARLMNAAVALDVPARNIVETVDTVSICLSKGLGAPAGSVLVGPAAFINRARRIRKMVGGGMRQSGVLAAAGLFALQNNVDDLSEDHRRARELADNLSRLPHITFPLGMPKTNMVFIAVPEQLQKALQMTLREHGVLVPGGGGTSRLVLHRDIDDSALERAMDAFQVSLKSL